MRTSTILSGLPSIKSRYLFSDWNQVLRSFVSLAITPSRHFRICSQRRYSSSIPKTIVIEEISYPTDGWTNLPSNIASSMSRRLHLQPDHPISLTRSIIESCFPSPTYACYNNFSPVVTTHQNFDSLGFPPDHPGRSKTDTYYINSSTVLRTHTSAHQADLFRANKSEGYLISADVYRRDAIDRSHYPIFHQIEGARTWDRRRVPNGDINAAMWKDVEGLARHNMKVDDGNTVTHPKRNPLQQEHKPEETAAIATHLKRSLELMIVEVFERAKKAAIASDVDYFDSPLKVRWVEAYFPFTSPSWELEIFWQGDWLEVLGCGVVKQAILRHADVPDQLGWAFGLGLERIAMLLFNIPDIRLFWSRDSRFLNQFSGLSGNLDQIKRFTPFSKYPGTSKDVAFWLKSSAVDGKAVETHENDVMEVVRDVAGDMAEDVRKIDEFIHPKSWRKSICYRVHYRSLEKTLTHGEANALHQLVREELVRRLGVELR